MRQGNDNYKTVPIKRYVLQLLIDGCTAFINDENTPEGEAMKVARAVQDAESLLALPEPNDPEFIRFAEALDRFDDVQLAWALAAYQAHSEEMTDASSAKHRTQAIYVGEPGTRNAPRQLLLEDLYAVMGSAENAIESILTSEKSRREFMG